MTIWKELRDAIMEVQHVLNDEDEQFPRSKANTLCEGIIGMISEMQHEPTVLTGWAPWREAAYAEMNQPMPSRTYMKNVRRQRHSDERAQ